MRSCVLFIAAACSSPARPHGQLAAVPQAEAADARGTGPMAVPPELLATPAPPAARPDPLGRGDCTAGTCVGRCVETGRLGELCASGCTRDADCRVDLGYLCDRTWNACLLPNTAVIVPAQCPTRTPARDLAFGDSTERLDLTTPVAELAADGALASPPEWSASYADASDCRDDAGACNTGTVVTGRDPLRYALYEAADGLRVRVSRDGGTTFTTGAIAAAGTSGSAAATSDGRLHLVTLAGGPLGGFGSAQHAVMYTVSSDGGATFTPPVAVSAPDELLPFWFARPSVAVDIQRRWIYAAYVRGGRDARWDIVVATSRDGGATWRRTTVAGDGCAIHMVPNLALDARTGTLHVAYYDSEGAPGRFVHASCGPGATKCQVHGAINSVPFAELSATRDPKKSVGDHATLLVDDKRRLLHAVWAQRVDEAGTRATRIFHGQARLKK